MYIFSDVIGIIYHLVADGSLLVVSQGFILLTGTDRKHTGGIGKKCCVNRLGWCAVLWIHIVHSIVMMYETGAVGNIV